MKPQELELPTDADHLTLHVPLDMRSSSADRGRAAFSIASSLGLSLVLSIIGLCLDAPRLVVWAILLGGAGAIFGARKLFDQGPGERMFVPGTLSIDGDNLSIRTAHATMALSRREIVGGWIEKSANGHAVVWNFRGGERVVVERPTQAEAQQLLRRADSRVDHMAVRMNAHGESSSGRLLAFVIALLCGLASLPATLFALGSLSLGRGGDAGAFLAWAMVTLMLWGLTVWMAKKCWPTWFEIATDGVTIRRIGTRFLRHADIARTGVSTGTFSTSLELVLVHGDVLKVTVATREVADTILEHIAAAKQAYSGARQSSQADESPA